MMQRVEVNALPNLQIDILSDTSRSAECVGFLFHHF
jgi:hypothetical protein